MTPRTPTPALIRETGACPDGANTYATLAEADAYLVPRGLWPVTEEAGEADYPPECPPEYLADGPAGEAEPEGESGGQGDLAPALAARKTAALLRASDYLNSLAWKGAPVSVGRHMAWPRRGVPLPSGGGMLAEGVLPPSVVQVCLELAALAFAGTDLLAAQPRGGRVLAESRSLSEGNIDVIGGESESVSRTYAANAPAEDYRPCLRLVAPYLATVPGMAQGARLATVGRA